MGEIRATIGTYSVDPKMLMERYLQEILDKRIQVYVNSGNGFSEEESYYLPDVYVEENLIEAEIPFDGNVTQLRIDPADRCCIVKIKTMLVNGQAVSMNKKCLITNGKALENDTYVFATGDPNMTVMVSELPMSGENTLSVELEIAYLPEGIAAGMATGKKGFFR